MMQPGRRLDAECRQKLLYSVTSVLAQDLQLGGFCIAALDCFGEVVQILACSRDQFEITSRSMPRMDG
jgi:hypothetical protein